ncbi:MAG: hypothetical protein VB858_18865 [Planctomycetaceae bacterium]
MRLQAGYTRISGLESGGLSRRSGTIGKISRRYQSLLMEARPGILLKHRFRVTQPRPACALESRKRHRNLPSAMSQTAHKHPRVQEPNDEYDC